jgi:hypothetical protein
MSNEVVDFDTLSLFDKVVFALQTWRCEMSGEELFDLASRAEATGNIMLTHEFIGNAAFMMNNGNPLLYEPLLIVMKRLVQKYAGPA